MSRTSPAEQVSEARAPGHEPRRPRRRKGTEGPERATGVEPAPDPEHGPATRSVPGLEIYGLLLTGFAILLLLSLVSFDPRDVALDHKLRGGEYHDLIGPVGAHVADLLLRMLGVSAFLGCSTFFYFGGLLLAGRRPGLSGTGVVAYLLALTFSSVAAHLLFTASHPFGHMPGGAVGEWVGEIMRALFATTGTVLITVMVLAASVLRLSGMTLRRISRVPARFAARAKAWLDGRRSPSPDTGPAPDGGHVEGAGAEPPIRLPAALPPRRAERPRLRSDMKAGDRPDYLNTAAPGDTAAPGPAIHDRAIHDRAIHDRAIHDRPTVPGFGAAGGATRIEGGPGQGEGAGGRPLGQAPDGHERAGPGRAGPDRSEPDRAEPDAAPKRTDSSDRPTVAPGDAAPSEPLSKGSEEEEPAAGPGERRAAPRRLVIADRVASSPPPLVADQKALPLDGLVTYEAPSLALLDYEAPVRGTVDENALAEAAETLTAKLADFGVKGQVVRIQPGPVVTTFELLPAAGIKISKIQNLADDLTMALHALRVRIVAPIPGKGVVGIEVPSAVRETVYLKEILASDEFQGSRARIPLALGKDIVGHPVVTDLVKLPHVLVAGATGSGKSVAINAFILSLVYRFKPRDLRMILVDPKMLELSVYDDIPHLLLPVVTEPKKATLALKWACAEMDRRYRLLAALGVRNLAGFNQKVEKLKSGAGPAPEGIGADELEHLPTVVIIVDELADLMMVAGKEVEKSIARLAQKARAAGLHLILATQRPSVDVITGLIKANFPSRISFMVSQGNDSKTILDRTGAEKLLGMGDMLYLSPGASRLIRAQGCFVSDDEVGRVAKHLKAFGPPEYDETILIDDEDEEKDLSGEDYDSLFDEAVQIVVDTGNPSISYLQRRLKIGYNRSARIIERMEFDGIISKADHRGVRKVLVQAAPED